MVNDNAPLKPETLEKLAKALRVPYEQLDRLSRGLGGDTSPSNCAANVEEGLDPLLAALHRLPIPQADQDFLQSMLVKYLDRFLPKG